VRTSAKAKITCSLLNIQIHKPTYALLNHYLSCIKNPKWRLLQSAMLNSINHKIELVLPITVVINATMNVKALENFALMDKRADEHFLLK